MVAGFFREAGQGIGKRVKKIHELTTTTAWSEKEDDIYLEVRSPSMLQKKTRRKTQPYLVPFHSSALPNAVLLVGY